MVLNNNNDHGLGHYYYGDFTKLFHHYFFASWDGTDLNSVGIVAPHSTNIVVYLNIRVSKVSML